MELKNTAKITVLIYFLGLVFFYFFKELESSLWFALGGGLALLNIFFAMWSIRYGMNSTRSKGIFLGLLLVKSFSFVAAVAVILMFLKPQLLPFTLGISVVIFGAIGAALWEIRHLRKVHV